MPRIKLLFKEENNSLISDIEGRFKEKPWSHSKTKAVYDVDDALALPLAVFCLPHVVEMTITKDV